MEKLKRISNSKYLPFIILGLLLFAIHFFINKTADDLWFQDILNNQTFKGFLESRYASWSSRTVIEAVLIMVSNTNVSLLIWKILDIFMFELLAYSIYKIFLKDNNILLLWILIFGVLTIPTPLLNGAGWIATTTNYLWPLALGMYVFTIIRKKCDCEKIKWYETIAYIVAAIYASNQEQMAAILFGIFSIYIAYTVFTKQVKSKIDLNIVIIYIITICSLAYILLCPGNKLRNIQETQAWYPVYQNYGLLSKIQLGITSMMRYLIIEGRLVFIVFTGLISYFTIITNKNIISKILGIIPFFGATIMNVFQDVAVKIFPDFVKQLNLYAGEELVINADNKMIFEIYMPILFYLFIVFIVVLDLYLIFKHSNRAKIAIIIVLTGFASRFILGFSPTVFASGERTSFFLYYSFVIVGLLVLKEMKDRNINIKNISCIYIVMSLFNILNLLSITK